MPREGQKIEDFLLLAFLLFMKKAAAEKNNIKQLLPVVLLRAVFEGGKVIPGAAKYQFCRSAEGIPCARAAHRVLHTVVKAQPLLPSIPVSTTHSPSKGGHKETSPASNFCSQHLLWCQ